MTAWHNHHPPHDHPDYDAYLDTLTEDDLAAIAAANDTANKLHNRDLENDPTKYF